MKTFTVLAALFVVMCGEPLYRHTGALAQQSSCGDYTEQEMAVRRANNIAKQERQNVLADSAGWKVVWDMQSLRARVSAGDLVSVPLRAAGYYVSDGYYSEPYMAPAALETLQLLSYKLSQLFPGERLRVPTLVRTHAKHLQLRRKNPNAASCETPLRCSAHRTGGAFDISTGHGRLSPTALKWLRGALRAMEARGEVIVIEEVCRPNFHVFVVPTPTKEVEMTPVAAFPRMPDEGGGR